MNLLLTFHQHGGKRFVCVCVCVRERERERERKRERERPGVLRVVLCVFIGFSIICLNFLRARGCRIIKPSHDLSADNNAVSKICFQIHFSQHLMVIGSIIRIQSKKYSLTELQAWPETKSLVCLGLLSSVWYSSVPSVPSLAAAGSTSVSPLLSGLYKIKRKKLSILPKPPKKPT